MSRLVSSKYGCEYAWLMRCQLCDDLFTFRAELKKVVVSIAKRLYGVFPTDNVVRKDVVRRHIADTASNLIKTSNYLRLPDSSDVSNVIIRCPVALTLFFREGTRILFRKFSRMDALNFTMAAVKKP